MVDQGAYNTITNPIPNYNRNPYLSKVVSNASRYGRNPSMQDLRASGVLSNAAAQSLHL